MHLKRAADSSMRVTLVLRNIPRRKMEDAARK